MTTVKPPAAQPLNFVIELYQQPGIEAQCLYLQDTFGADIPLLLFVCWYSVAHGRLSPATHQTLYDESRVLTRMIVAPLRQVRRSMKQYSFPAPRSGNWEQLRQQIKQAELNAEFHTLTHLEDIVRRQRSLSRAVSAQDPMPVSSRVQRNALTDNLQDYCRLALARRLTPLTPRTPLAQDAPAGPHAPDALARSLEKLVSATLRLASDAPAPDQDQTDQACDPHAGQ